MSNKKVFKGFQWSERSLVYIKEDELTDEQRYRVTESDHFCIIPWIHLHGWPTGEAFPCCLGEADQPVGNFKENTIAEIWNGDKYKKMRQNMMADKPCKECTRCYEQEEHGFASMRINTNRHFGQHVVDVDKTHKDGYHPEMKFKYWDIRFSNVCNLKCRTCGGIFSSKWHNDETALNGGIPMRDKVLFAGKHELDIWEQMEDQIQYLEQIYFAGGEPLMMEEHYRILDKLIETGNTNIRLVYNTNLTAMQYKGKFALDYWKHFPNVSVAASLDGMGALAEIVRSGTNWDKVEVAVQELNKECPHVDFLISPTLSVMNAWQLPEFHRYMIDKGYLKPMDLNVNMLQSPDYYRIDMFPQEVKDEITKLYQAHIAYLEPLDTMGRAVDGFRSAIKFMQTHVDETVAQHNRDEFWKVTVKLDKLRKESILDIIPQLEKYK